MSGTFDVDVQQIQQVSQDWSTETQAMAALPGQLSSIEGQLSSLLEHSFLQDLFDPAAEVIQTGIWFALRDSLNKASGELGTLVQQLQEDAQLLNRCSIEYQIADDAAANNITDIQSALSSNAPGSTQIRALLSQLSGSDQGTAEQAAQGLLGSAAGGGGTTTPGGGGGSTTGGGGTSSSGGGGTATAGGSGGSSGASGSGSNAGTGSGNGGSAGGSGGSGTGSGSGSSGGSGTGAGSGSGTGSGSGSGGSGGGGSGTGSGSTPGITNTSGGNWRTSGNWDTWVTSGHHAGPKTGDGMQTKLPDYDTLPQARRQIMTNMVARVDHKVGYSRSATTNGYRDDSSGTVSAAWGLKEPGEDCAGLMSSSVSHPIAKDQLQPGDALIAQDHVVLFGGWANKEHTEYYALEDNADQGTVAHVVPYPYYAEKGATSDVTYKPFAKNGV